MQTPDARDLALALAEGVWERNTLYVGARNHWLSEAAQLIAAHDARLLDEAAERGVRWVGNTLGYELEELESDTLRAAIKGAAHE